MYYTSVEWLWNWSCPNKPGLSGWWAQQQSIIQQKCHIIIGFKHRGETKDSYVNRYALYRVTSQLHLPLFLLSYPQLCWGFLMTIWWREGKKKHLVSQMGWLNMPKRTKLDRRCPTYNPTQQWSQITVVRDSISVGRASRNTPSHQFVSFRYTWIIVNGLFGDFIRKPVRKKTGKSETKKPKEELYEWTYENADRICSSLCFTTIPARKTPLKKRH